MMNSQPTITKSLPAFDLSITDNEDISSGVEWQINSHSHTIILHHHGIISELATELNGYGKSLGGANPGEIWIVPANSHYHACARGHHISYSVLSITPRASATLAELSAFHGVWDGTYYHAIQTLKDYQDDSDTSQLMRASCVDFICGHLQHYYGQRPDTPGHRQNPQFSKALTKALQKYIYNRLQTPLTLTAMADFAGMTSHQFLIAFRHAFLTSPAQYIIDQRLRLARQLLLATTLDITSIALNTGFASHSHLTTTFKRKFNCTPKQFRQYWI